MKKNMLYAGWGLLLFGVALLCLGWFVDDRLGGVFNGFAGAMAGIGIGNLIRWNRLQKEPDGELASILRQTQIEEKDERNRMLRERSGYITMIATMLLLCCLTFGFKILDAFDIWPGFSQPAVWFCYALLMLMLLVHFVAIKVLNNKL